MVWIPAAFLIIFCPLIIASLLETKTRIEWNFYNKIRQFLSFAQIILSLSECITVLVKYFQSEDIKPSLPDIYGSFIRLFCSVKKWLIVKNSLRNTISKRNKFINSFDTRSQFLYYLCSKYIEVCTQVVSFGFIFYYQYFVERQHFTDLFIGIRLNFMSGSFS